MGDLDRFLEVALLAAERAGDRTLDYFGQLDPAAIGFKGARDLVTRADLESEQIITGLLRESFPEHHLLAEEEMSRGGVAVSVLKKMVADGPYTWIIDPLDGTTSFAHTHPFYAVSIALFERSEPLLAVVFGPALDELFVAARGQGCTLNGKQVRVSPVESLGDAVFATGFPYHRDQLSAKENNVEHFNRFIHDVRGFRRGGSAALDLAYVAAGRFGFFFEAQLEPWDVAGGALLVKEAGGTVTDYANGENWLFGRQILASNGRLHETVRARLVE
ncbi:MAG: inositol monophosphatase family protein [Planctomycetota bacterium]